MVVLLLIGHFCLAENNPIPQSPTDSLKRLVDSCNSDAEKFKILSKYFWKNGYDIDHIKPIGNWAYEVIKESNDTALLCYGFLIKGIIYKSERKYDSASVILNNALRLSGSKNNKYLEAVCYSHLGDIDIYNGDFDASLMKMKTAYTFFHEINKDKDAAKKLYNIANIYEKKGMLDSAINYYNRRLHFFQSQSDTLMIIYSYFGFSNFYKRHNDAKRTIFYLKEAMQMSSNISDPEVLFSVNLTIGNFFAEQKKNYPIALSYYQKVLAVAETQKANEQLTFLHISIGNIYREEGNDSLALQFHKKSLEIARKMDHRHYKSNAYEALGNDYKKVKDFRLALECFRTAYEMGCQECAAISFHEALIGMSDMHLMLSHKDSALARYNESLALADRFNASKEIGLSHSKIGDFYMKMGQYRLAEEHYLKSLKFSQEVDNLPLIASVSDSLSSLYVKSQEYIKANKFLQLAKTMADSLYELEKQTDISEFAVKLEYEKIKEETRAKEELANAEIEKQKMFRDLLIVISVLLIGFGIFAFLSYRRKKSDYKLLSEKAMKIEEKNHEIQVQVEEITGQKNEIERISAELHEADATKLRFFSNISHEFRTPLTLIINPLQKLLESKADEQEQKIQLEKIHKNAQKLLDLTNQILDLQKLDAGKLQLNIEKTDLVEYCLAIISSFESMCDQKGNSIHFVASHRSIVTGFDKDKTGKIVVNLLSNALKFCFEATSIDIHLRLTGDIFQFTIADQGIGIPAEQIDNIFKRYFQVPSASQATGTGIGLAYVKELVNFMSGEISIQSKEGKGTTICVSIPVRDFEIPDKTEFETVIPTIKRPMHRKEFDAINFFQSNQKENTVLIVEDNDELREFIAGLFNSDFNVHLASNGVDGFNAAFEYMPDIIISDVMMPQKDGFELCAQLKNDERTSHIPVILLTAKDTPQSSLEGYQTGADDYIVKPFENEHLKLKVRNIIATHEAKRKQFDFKTISSIEDFKLGNTDRKFILKCITMIQENIDDSSFSVEKLAEALAFSKRNFYRKTMALINQTPAELIRVYRLQYARQLLQNTDMKVFEVASSVGYEDLNSFRMAFKKQFGFPPSESSLYKIG